MATATISERIADLRRLERRLRLVWGATSFVALVVVVMLLACLADWRIDLDEDTPRTLRWAMLGGQVLLWLVAGYFLLLRPIFSRRQDDDLAVWVEQKLPIFEQRLISVTQSDRRGLTYEAEKLVLASQLLDPPDRRRLRWGIILAVVAAVLLASSWWFFGEAFPVLIARQFLAGSEIPRTVRILSNDSTWPPGEAAVLLFSVASKKDLEAAIGVVLFHTEGGAVEAHPMTARNVNRLNRRPMIVLEFRAEIPPGSAHLRFRARLRDGRSKWHTLRYVPRPATTKEEVWVLLPKHAGLRPDGRRYAQPQTPGETIAIEGSQLAARVETNIPLQSARLVVSSYAPSLLLAQWRAVPAEMPLTPLAVPVTLVAQSFGDRARRELLASDQYSVRMAAWGEHWYLEPRFRVMFDVAADGLSANAEAALDPTDFEYQFAMTGREGQFDGFSTRRRITVLPDEPPVVTLLPEFEVNNVLPPGAAVPVAYYCRDSLGLDRAELRYRINDGPWRRMPLPEAKADEAKGPFDPGRGVFLRSSKGDQVNFHAVASPDPDSLPGRLEGGGRFDFQTRDLGLKPGDVLEYCVEVYDRNPEPNRPPGRSEIRRKVVGAPRRAP